MLSDEELKRIAEGKDETMTPVMRRERMELARELLAIRERQASAYAGAAPDAFTDAMERAVLGLPPPAPQRRYSEEEVRALLNALNEQMRPGDYIDIEAAMRRLRGEGEAKPETPLWTCAIDSCKSEWEGFAKGCEDHPSVAWLPLNTAASWALVKAQCPRAYALLQGDKP